MAKTAPKAPELRIAEALERIASALEIQNELARAVTFNAAHEPFRRSDGSLSPRYLRVLSIAD